MSPPDDLKQQFAALREEDAGKAPSFAGTLAAARARRESRGSATWAWAALVGAAAVVAIVAVPLNLAGPGVSTPVEPVPLAGMVDQWVAPTDGLLASAELPGSPGAMFSATAEDIAFFSSPTADLLGLVDDPTARTP